MRQRCYDCYRPIAFCFCDKIPVVDNRTDVLILQHMRERFHAFNTARIVAKALVNCVLVADHNERLASQQLPLMPNVGLLYPGDDAKLLSDVPGPDRPEQLVIIDGTWHHAKTMVRDIPILRKLRRYRLAPTKPGQYRIRREPDAVSLSTVEATVAALKALEPETPNLDQLLEAFRGMVDNQIAHPSHQQNWRQKTPRTVAHIPRLLLGDLKDVVVAYGEADWVAPGKRQEARWPIAWAAERLGTGEQFSCTIQPRAELSLDFVQHLGRTAEEFSAGATRTEFADKWQAFLRPQDQLVVYNQSTVRLLTNIGVDVGACLALKSIDIGIERRGRALDKLLQQANVEVPSPSLPGRAGQRLANAIAWVHHLRGLANIRVTV